MARFPTDVYSPVSTVSADVQQPSNYDRAEATPQDFGAQVGQATESLGKTGTGASVDAINYATQQQELYNDVAANDAFNKHQTLANNLMYGDPNDPNDHGYMALKGADALNGRADAIKKLNQSSQDLMQGMPTMAGIKFQDSSRRLNQNIISEIGAHANQEFTTYAVSTAAATQDNALKSIGMRPNDEENFQHSLADMQAAAVKEKAARGYNSPEDVAAAQADAQSKAYTQRIETLAATDPRAAMTMAQANASKMDGPTYAQLVERLKPKVTTLDANGAAGTALGAADATYRSSIVPSGPLTTKITAVAAQAGISNSLALTSANIESGIGRVPDRPGSTIKGVFQMSDGTWAARGGTAENRGDVNAQVALGIDNLKHSQDVAQSALGAKPQDWQSYLVHQQGDAGGAALLKADPAASAVSALAPAYGGDVGRATAAVVQNGGNANSTVGQFLGHWQQTYAAKQIGSAGDAPSIVPPPMQTKADYYRSNEEAIVNQAKAQYDTAHPDDPVGSELAENRARQQVHAVINDQDTRYKADYDRVVQAANGDLKTNTHPMTVDQLTATSPEVAAAWDRLTHQQPEVAHQIATRLLTENAKTAGKDVTEFGPGYNSIFQRINLPSGDPNKITDDRDIIGQVGKDGGDGITQAGLRAAREELAGRNTAEGKSFLEQKAAFYKYANTTLSAKNDFTGQKDPRGEEQYAKFTVAADAYIKNYKGDRSDIFNVKSPAYIGNVIDQFKRTPAQIARDMVESNSNGTETPPEVVQPSMIGRMLGEKADYSKAYDLSTPDGIKDAYFKGKMPRADAEAALAKLGYVSRPTQQAQQ